MNESLVAESVPNQKRKVFFGLFVFPMLIAVTMAILLSGIVLLTHEDETPESLITAIKTGAPSKRWQKAFELSNELNRQGGIIPLPALSAKGGISDASRRQAGGGMIRSAGIIPPLQGGRMIRSGGIMNEVIYILNDKEHYDAKTRAYMAMALSRFQDPEAEAALRKTLGNVDDSEDPKFTLFAIWALGNFKNPDSAQTIAHFLQSEHDDVRKTAAYILGALGDKKVIPALEHTLEDSVVDVRWNAALSLARLGNVSGGEILLQMLDRNHLRQAQQLNEAEIERAMVNAARALSLIRYPEAAPILKNISEADPNLKVREAARATLQQNNN